MTCFGISDQVSYPVQEFMLNDTLKNGTSRVGLYGSAPLPTPQASTLNIREVVKFYNLGHKSSETDFWGSTPGG